MTTNSKFSTKFDIAEVVRFIRDTTRRLQAEDIDLFLALDHAIAERFPEIPPDQRDDFIEAERDEFEAEWAREVARNLTESERRQLRDMG
ncbi:hypothetical protein SAMN05443247_01099 [Bradyrhizobium erythrophlei]|nr:hypothetical protein SAMN05443247_01099 [Bradyrhizobium erythrophlei]